VGRRDWRWWEEFERTDPVAGTSDVPQPATERRNAVIIRWVVTVGWSVLAVFKVWEGAWLFAAAYAVCAIGFFFAYGVAARRRKPPAE
jgi:hypothetical protein